MDAIEAGLAHIKKMKQTAEELTKDLGLPPEYKYKVLSAAYNVDPSLVGGLQNVQAKLDASSEARLKKLVYQLSEDYLNVQMQEQITTFQALWERLKTLPLEVISELGQQTATSQGIGFTGGERFQQSLSIISTVSWAVVQYPVLSKADSEYIQAAIAKEAEARGCSRELSNSVAHYVRTHAPYNASQI